MNKFRIKQIKSRSLIFFLLASFFVVSVYRVLAIPPTSPYFAGETLDPTCAPGDPECTVGILESRDEGGSLTYQTRALDFVGAGVTATEAGGVVTVSIAGGISGLTNGTTTIASGTDGAVLFQDGGVLSQNATNFFWDNTTDRLGIGTSSPAHTLDISGTGRLTGNLTLGSTLSASGLATFLSGINVNSETITDFTGAGLSLSGGALTLSTSGDWTGTFDGQEGTYYLSRANHTGTQLASTISDFSTSVQGLIDTSAELVGILTDETGSGALVFGTSPTIASPTLSGTISGTYTLGGTPTLGTHLALGGATRTIGDTGGISITTAGNVGIGDTTPASLFTVGSGDLFQVDTNGDIVKLKNLTYSWPSSHTAGVLKNNGSGILSWGAISSSDLSDSSTSYLKLDQTTPQTVTGGAPNFSGGLGIGVFPSASYSLETSGNIGIQGNKIYFETDIGGSQTLSIGSPTNPGSTSLTRYLNIGTSATGITLDAYGSVSSALLLNAGGNYGARVQQTGTSVYFGIGTLSPSAKLDVDKTYNDAVPVATLKQSHASGTGDLLQWKNSSSTLGSIDYQGNINSDIDGNGNGGITSGYTTGFAFSGGVGGIRRYSSGSEYGVDNYTASSYTLGSTFRNTAGANYVQTTGTIYGIQEQHDFEPTSGTAVFNALTVNGIINQTGGANGITRGLYINPTLTAAADWKSIEWSNTTGYGLYGAGTANNYLAGSLGVGVTSPTAKVGIESTTEQLRLRYNSSNYSKFTVNSAGGLTLTPSGDTTTAYNFTKADGTTSVLNIDTNSTRIGINSSSPSYGLDVNTTSMFRDNLRLKSGVQILSTGSSYYHMYLQKSGGSNFYMQVYDVNGIFTWNTQNGELMRLVGSTGNLGIGDTTPASLFTVGNGDLFQIDSSGDIVKLKNLTYSWPSSHTTGVLKNNGSGTLSWGAISSSDLSDSSTSYLKLDQTTPQTVTGGAPRFNTGIALNTAHTGTALLEFPVGAITAAEGIKFDNINFYRLASSAMVLSQDLRFPYGTGVGGTNTDYGELTFNSGTPNTFSRDRSDATTMLLMDNRHAAATGNFIDFQNSSVMVSSITRGGDFLVGNGTAASPSLSFYTDRDNGMYLSGTNEISFATGGQQRTTIDANGYMGIGLGANTAQSKLHIRTDAIGSGVPATTTGIYLQNTTPAISGTQQWSPSFTLEGRAYRTGIGTEYPISYKTYVSTTEANSPNGTYIVDYSSPFINGNAFYYDGQNQKFGVTGALIASTSVTALNSSVSAYLNSGFILSAGVLKIDRSDNTTVRYQASPTNPHRFTNGTNLSTSSEYGTIWTNTTFAPTSGTAVWNTVKVYPTINQTGGANGITRGVYVDPTLTSAADWRSIEFSNSTGYGIYGAGTASNYLAGNLGIGDSTPDYKLDIETDVADFTASFFNDGNANTRKGLIIQGGVDDHTAVDTSTLAEFRDGDGTTVGSVTFGSSVTSYNTTSDERLKTDIEETSIGLEDLMRIQVRDYTWRADKDSKHSHGFIAQELFEIYPSAVTVPVDSDDFWMVDYSKLTPLVVKSVQDLYNTVHDFMSLDVSNPHSILSIIRNFLADATNSIDTIFARVFKGDRAELKTLCLDDLCITKDELQRLLDTASIQQTGNIDSGGGESNTVGTQEENTDIPLEVTEEGSIDPQSEEVVDEIVPPVDDTNIPIELLENTEIETIDSEAEEMESSSDTQEAEQEVSEDFSERHEDTDTSVSTDTVSDDTSH